MSLFLSPARRRMAAGGGKGRNFVWGLLLAEGTYSPTCKHVGVFRDVVLHSQYETQKRRLAILFVNSHHHLPRGH